MKKKEITLEEVAKIQNKFWSDVRDVQVKTDKRSSAHKAKRPLYLIHSTPETRQ